MLEVAFLQFSLDLTPSWDPFLQQKNDDVNNELLERENIEAEQDMQTHQLKLVLFLLMMI